MSFLRNSGYQAIRAAQDNAARFFKSQRGYATVVVQTSEKLQEINRNMSPDQRSFGSNDRLVLLLLVLDMYAESYLQLVTDQKSLDHFEALIRGYGQKAWEDFTGNPIEFLPPVGEVGGSRFQTIVDRLQHWKIEGYKVLKALEQPSASPEVHHTPMAQKQPATQDSEGSLETLREQMLAAYKTATGNPSNRQIYGAQNSGIHKPEFYEWLNGTLLPDSATTINFERFLKLKKPPIPRATKS